MRTIIFFLILGILISACEKNPSDINDINPNVQIPLLGGQFDRVFHLELGFVVSETNDTIFGSLKNKNYYSKGVVKLYQDNNKIKYAKKPLSEIHLDNDFYVKSDLFLCSSKDCS